MASNDSYKAEHLNHEEVERLVPLLVYLAVIVLTGIPGNILVFVIYRKNAAKSNFQFFISWLAVIDFITCCTVFFLIFSVTHQYTFHGNWMCKCTTFFGVWPTFISVGTLCVIGIDRYRKVCKPHGRQISHKMAKIICAILVLLGAVFSWPILILFGERGMTIYPHNVTGVTCAVMSEFDNTIYPKIFNGLLWILFTTALLVIALLYIFIGRRIFQHARKLNNGISIKCEQNNIPEASIGTILSNEQSEDFDRYEIILRSEASIATIAADGQTDDSILADTETTNKKQSKANRRNPGISRMARSKSRKESQAKRSVLIMFLISLILIVSFLPYLILRLIEALNVDFIYTMSNEARSVYKFFLRSYYINCAVNPFVYCVCATKFRNDAKALFVRSFRRFSR